METTGVSGENRSIWGKREYLEKTEYMETTGVSGENGSIWGKTGVFRENRVYGDNGSIWRKQGYLGENGSI
jgi:hypothetical protein